jgi:hypothetical protein
VFSQNITDPAIANFPPYLDGRVDPEDWHNRSISRQRELEKEDPLLPGSVWPACGARTLLCTREAAVRMQEIVDTIGTETEKKRATLVLNLDNNALLSRNQRLEEFQKLSDYAIPLEWKLPIEIVDIEMTCIMSKLPRVAEKVSEVLISINRAVFLFGWSASMTTLSSNGTVAKEIEVVIERENMSAKESDGQFSSGDTKGPDIWLSPSARSLVGKMKNRN